MTAGVAYNGRMESAEIPLAVGQSVKFINPLTDDERGERFIVLELRSERVLVEFICDMTIRPTFVYPTADLVSVEAVVHREFE